ncbi:hypothetical protein [Actinoplanes sp. N902-109]|uniref:hypothetical protein n=1 Tax=Actinoplanes sp. (strain N902-109) TaxID=649831 RepID=UPI0005A2AE0A|nr:hypothetical protein [Actinoplanes sp. N902-109]
MSAIDTNAVILLCGATLQAMPSLGLEPSMADELNGALARARKAVSAEAVQAEAALSEVRMMRYILVEAASGPLAAFLADSAARIIGDDIGRLFS